MTNPIKIKTIKKSQSADSVDAIKIESTDEFFAKGKKLASLADKGILIEESKAISFEDAEDLETTINQLSQIYGSNFDDFLIEEGILEEVKKVAMERVKHFIKKNS
jgi:hypothetical protein